MKNYKFYFNGGNIFRNIGLKLSIFSVILLLQSFLSLSAQTVSGVVKDKNGEPLIGVSVQLKGTQQGTITNLNGNYSIPNVKLGEVLVFSYIGYSPIEEKVTSNVLNVVLYEDTRNLNEVVVVGYGTQKKSVVTGAISHVSAKDLQDQVTPRIEDALKGRTSGVTVASNSGSPGTAASVSIRGVTSINSSAPLYVIDGIPVENGGLDFLNQSDIESIEVLKDAASAAIYGTRAAAGVILVTTKKGTSGKLKVNVDAYYGTQAPEHILNLTNATQYATLRNESLMNADMAPKYANPASLGAGTDWQSAVFNKDARIQNYEVSFSGGNDKSTMYSSFGYFSQEGIVTSSISNYSRISARFNTNNKMNNWLTFGNNLSFSHIKSSGINENGYFGGPLTSAIHLDPTTPIVETDPTVLTQARYANNSSILVRDANGNPYGISDVVGQEMTNPLAFSAINQGNYGWADKLVGNVFLEIEPIKNLKIRSTLGGELSFWGGEGFTPLFFLSATVNNTAKNSYTRSYNRKLDWTWTNTVSYTGAIDVHHFTGLLGTEARDISDVKGTSLTYTGIPSTSFQNASMDYTIPVANINGWGYENQPYRLSSIFARLNYDYDGKYMFTGIIRRDGSSHFGSNNVYGYFPSVSAGWLVSNEGFWKENNTIDMLKLRVGYGVNGNDNLPPFQYTSIIQSLGGYTFGNDQALTGYGPQTVANPDLRWEQTSQTNIGIDAVLFRNLTATVEFFNKTTTGMLMQVKLPGYVGAASNPYGNVASMYNNGVELDLGYHFNVGGLRFDLKGNASYIENKVTNIGSNDFLVNATMQASSYEISRKAVGQPVNEFYGFETAGIFQNQAQINSYVNSNGVKMQPNAVPGDFKWKDINGDGVIDDKDRTYLGNPTPNFVYGFTMNLNYKNFDLVLFGQGVSGNKIFQELRRLDILTANYPAVAMTRWTGEGTSNTYPRLTDNDTNGNFGKPSNFYLEDGSYFRIKNLQIGYNIPKNVLQKIQFEKARIYASANNLLTLTKYTGFDPEIGGSQDIFGVDRGVYPQARSFMLGIDVTF